MKKILVGALALGSMVGVACMLTSCGGDANGGNIDAFDYNMVNAISLLDSNVGGATTGLKAYTEGISDEEKKIILDNLEIAKNTLSSGIVKSEVKKSDKPEYENYYTLSTETLTGTNDVYEFYYNGTVIEKEKSNDKDKLKEEIEGICYINEELYSVTGKVETEDDESEIKIEIRLDDDNYVKIKSETEDNEIEYQYELFKDGKLSFKSKVEYEIDEDGEIDLEFKTQKSDGEFRFCYEFYHENNNSYVEVEIKQNGGNIKQLLKVIDNGDGTISYEFID